VATGRPKRGGIDQLKAWRDQCADELEALPPRIRTDRDLGRKRNLELSILTINRGPGVLHDTGFAIENLPVGELIRAAGYEAAPTVAVNAVATLPWFGSISEVEHRISKLTKRRADAAARLAEAMLDDPEREHLAAEGKAPREASNAAPQRKTRGDGSQYDKYPDGRVVEISR
jgi:hypothetical protein